MAKYSQHPAKWQSADTSDQSQTKRPSQKQGYAAMLLQRTPAGLRRDTGQDEGMKRPTNQPEFGKG